jgi:hypothetical protein
MESLDQITIWNGTNLGSAQQVHLEKIGEEVSKENSTYSKSEINDQRGR